MKSFDRVAEAYDASRGLSAAAAADVTAGILATLHEVSPSPRLLEVGIGTGRIAVPLAAAGVRVVGIDVSWKMLALLRAKRSDLLVLRADAARLPFRSACFDGALFVHVLHLVADAARVLRAATTAVRDGGILVMGRTDYGASSRHTVAAWIAELQRELGGGPPAPDVHALARDAFRAHAASLGAEVFSRQIASWQETTTGRKLLDGLSRRLYSNTWDIPDAVLPELVGRLTPRVEELFGGLDQTIVTEGTFSVDTCRLAAAA